MIVFPVAQDISAATLPLLIQISTSVQKASTVPMIRIQAPQPLQRIVQMALTTTREGQALLKTVRSALVGHIVLLAQYILLNVPQATTAQLALMFLLSVNQVSTALMNLPLKFNVLLDIIVPTRRLISMKNAHLVLTVLLDQFSQHPALSALILLTTLTITLSRINAMSANRVLIQPQLEVWNVCPVHLATPVKEALSLRLR